MSARHRRTKPPIEWEDWYWLVPLLVGLIALLGYVTYKAP